MMKVFNICVAVHGVLGIVYYISGNADSELTANILGILHVVLIPFSLACMIAAAITQRPPMVTLSPPIYLASVVYIFVACEDQSVIFGSQRWVLCLIQAILTWVGITAFAELSKENNGVSNDSDET